MRSLDLGAAATIRAMRSPSAPRVPIRSPSGLNEDARAAKLGDPSAQAWAMRDAFDGLVEVIERKLGR